LPSTALRSPSWTYQSGSTDCAAPEQRKWIFEEDSKGEFDVRNANSGLFRAEAQKVDTAIG
jgi:hypothetical protein